MRRVVSLLALALPLAACAAHPPPNWAQGGAALPIPQARWERGDRSVEILPDGRVMVEGEHWFSVDAAGRVFEPGADPIAVLQQDGMLVGTDNHAMGRVGTLSASLPGAETAWFSIGPRGEVVRYDEDGDRHQDGGWGGCGPAVRTCTLVTHLVSVMEARRRPHVGVGIGFGIGFGR